MIRGFFYRLIMRIAHRYHWHYAPPIFPETKCPKDDCPYVGNPDFSIGNPCRCVSE